MLTDIFPSAGVAGAAGQESIAERQLKLWLHLIQAIVKQVMQKAAYSLIVALYSWVRTAMQSTGSSEMKWKTLHATSLRVSQDISQRTMSHLLQCC
jgi:hypothetical protein